MKKYDVFISSKSEDYKLANQVYDFLVKNGVKVFFAYRVLGIYGGATDGDIIDEALDNSTHMVVVSSSIENINSKYVRYEWSTFSSDLRKGYRSGNLFTILTDSVELKELPPSLRHNQAFRFKDYKERILSYVKPGVENQNGDSSAHSGKKRGWVVAAILASIVLAVTLGYYIFSHNKSDDSKVAAVSDSVEQRHGIVSDSSKAGDGQDDYIELASIPRPKSLPKGKGHNVGGTQFDWLAQRYATLEDINTLDQDENKRKGQIRVLKNSIYARHGYIFRDTNLTNYFCHFGWYKGERDTVPTSVFNKFEKANIKFLGKYDH